jgi:predicted nucleotidyltransferase
MKVCGIIVEYNPFHNGHLYHINQVKQNNCDLLIAVMSGNFTQRGELAILDKFRRTELALTHGVDVVIELPYAYATSSADLFSLGAISILNHLKVDELYFGSETNDIKKLTHIASLLDSKAFNDGIQVFLNQGLAYPKASQLALNELLEDDLILLSNDLLGIQYIRRIKQLQSTIEPKSIQRIANQYRDLTFSHHSIASATSIRQAVKNKQAIIDYVPELTHQYLTDYANDWDHYFDWLQYQIIANEKNLHLIHDMTEGLHNRIIEANRKATNFHELTNLLSSKRHTESKIRRILAHILTNYTEEEFQQKQPYIRVLGFNREKSQLFKKVIKDCSIPVITNITKSDFHLVEIENRIDDLYYHQHPLKNRKIPIQVKI